MPDRVPLASLPPDLAAPMTFAERLQAYGNPPADIEDRRGEPTSGWLAMRRGATLPGMMVRDLFPWLRNFDLSLPQPEIANAPTGKLGAQAGLYDIPQQSMPWLTRLGHDLEYAAKVNSPRQEEQSLPKAEPDNIDKMAEWIYRHLPHR